MDHFEAEIRICQAFDLLRVYTTFYSDRRGGVFVLLGEVTVCVETPKTLEAVSQVSSCQVTNTTHIPRTDQLSTWALDGYTYIHSSKQVTVIESYQNVQREQ